MRFFSSMRLTIFTLFFLAISSIIGTVIPQKETFEFYVENFGENLAKLFQILSVPDMYNSWWFVSFLILLSINLIICTIDRFPNIWRLVTADILSQDPTRLEKMSNRLLVETTLSQAETTKLVSNVLNKAGWQTRQTNNDEGNLIGAQKGSWTRLGFMTVHISILIIFIGAIIGYYWGYKGSVMIPEGAAADKFYEFGSRKAIPIDFQVRCDRFSLTFYETGAPKEYRSDLTVLEDGKEILKKSIVVNDPMNYKGLTFYQSSYEGSNEFLVTIKDTTTNEEQQFLVPPGKQIKWTDETSFGILNISGPGQAGGNHYKIWFNDSKGDPSTFWMADNKTVTIQRPETAYAFNLRQRFSTGLQVTKDPGVWYVYSGCGLMIFGLFMTFFLSHRRIWVFTTKKDSGTRIVFAGTANKNKVGFERDFEIVATLLKKNDQLNLIEG